jgi:type 1 fimbriae regulatory protein FimE
MASLCSCRSEASGLVPRALRRWWNGPGKAAKLPFSVHPHMLRHACGFNLAATGADTRAIQGYLGHRSIKSTERYTALSPDRFKGFAERLRGR